MKLNPDCIRGLLLTVEEKCDFEHMWEYERNALDSEYLSGYNHNEIAYHIRYAEEANLITGVTYYDFGESILIRDLSSRGHDFLDNIRNDAVWKKVIAKGSSASLPVLIELAGSIALKYFLG